MDEKTHFEQVPLEEVTKLLDQQRPSPEKAQRKTMFESNTEGAASIGSPRFDLFRVETSGEVCWMGTAENRVAAEKHLMPHAVGQASAQFILLDQSTGTQTYLSGADLGQSLAG